MACSAPSLHLISLSIFLFRYLSIKLGPHVAILAHESRTKNTECKHCIYFGCIHRQIHIYRIHYIRLDASHGNSPRIAWPQTSGHCFGSQVGALRPLQRVCLFCPTYISHNIAGVIKYVHIYIHVHVHLSLSLSLYMYTIHIRIIYINIHIDICYPLPPFPPPMDLPLCCLKGGGTIYICTYIYIHTYTW